MRSPARAAAVMLALALSALAALATMPPRRVVVVPHTVAAAPAPAAAGQAPAAIPQAAAPMPAITARVAALAPAVGAPAAMPAPAAVPAPALAANVGAPTGSVAAPAPPAAGQGPGPAVTIDRAAVIGPIDNMVYGANSHVDDERHTTRLKFPISRWGGNAATRHNWKANTTNRAADWFFMNIPDATFAHGGRMVGFADHVVLTVKERMELLYTIPTIGWIPKDRETRWGFSVAKYGAQEKTEQWHPDAGNGVRVNGKPMTGNDATDTSMRIGPEWVAEWVRHFKETLGGKGARDGGIRFYALDNEPDLWHQTHRDVRQGDDRLKSPYITYDELWERTASYAAAIKTADPGALITGPVTGIWCDYFTSSADVNDGDGDCRNGKDRKAHGGQPILAWYLKKICETQAKTGVRLVDYLDVHFYPENLDLDSEDPKIGKDRLSRVRALYDPGFVDPSWIKEPVRLIPRLKEWIKDNCPGTKIALTEYRFGWNDGQTSALAQAEALAVLGREGVDLATTWGPIAAGGLLEGAYRLFLDYDGHGASALGGTAVRAAVTGADPTMLTAYAIATPRATLVYVFNKDAAKTQTVRLALAGDAARRPARLFRFGKGGIEPAQSTELPPWSAILAVFEP